LALDPMNANAHSGLGILLLMRGDLAEGWEEYEWRLKSTEVRLPYIPQRPWLGESLQGRRIYVHAEQGFGDTIQFARYLPLVKARGATVTFRVQQGLAGLMRQSLDGIEVLGDRGAPAQTADCESALLSLPRLFETRLETIPATVPYLRADPAEAARWRARLGGAGLKVGIAWAGNPEHVNDSRRSIDLPELAALFAVPGVTFTSLQVGSRAADLGRHPDLAITDISADLVGFAATAAAMAALDLVITIDSAVTHLAGALAKPTWLLMPWVSDWRWLLGCEDNPWYPTARLFRQGEGEPWRAVAARVAQELARVAAGDAAPLTPFRAAGEKRAHAAAEIIAAREGRLSSANREPPRAPLQMLAVAEQRRQAGKLAEAEALARRVIEAMPECAEAYHLLGIVAHQSGNLGHAIEHVKRAAALAPDNALYHANLGEMCRLAGRLDDALAEGRRALELRADYPDALNNLGIAHYERGDYGEALARYDRATELRPGFVEAHSNRGNALRAVKRLDEAVASYRRALELRPGFADAWNNLGTTLRDLKRPEEAEAAYRQALTLKQDEPETLNNLALALKDLDRLGEAEATLRRSLAIETHNAKTLLYLGTLLLDLNRTDDAADAIRRALAIDPGNGDIVNASGRAAFERGDLAGALQHYRRALELKPDLADAYNNMGNVLKELGRLDEAEAAYLKSLALDAKSTGAYVNLADSHRFVAGDAQLRAMEELAAQAGGLSKTDRMQLDFALAKAYADMKDYRRSFEHLARGNAAKRAQVAYDEAATMALFDRVEAVFTPALIERQSGGGDSSPVPIFVLGMPRSGTTLVEQILASHPKIFGGGELKCLNDVVSLVHGPDGNSIPYPDFVPSLDAAALASIGMRYVAELRRLAPEAARITDKMPSNYYFIGLIHLALPNARIIHTVRDPLDTCLSCFSKLFTAEQNHTYDLAELGRYYRRYDRLMAHWRRVLPKGRFLEVRYEDVVADLEGAARRILGYCGLEWDPRCLAFDRTERPVRTASATQVRRPIYRSAVGRARAYAEFLGPLRAALAGDADS
jgi:tetratricopeptide (TPR) repeat protein